MKSCSLHKLNLLIINTTQFGYHTDTLMYTRYIDRSKYDIKYFCFDMGYPKIYQKGTSIYYVPLSTNRLIRYFKFINALVRYLSENSFAYIFHVYNKFTLMTRVFCLSKRMILDIRTGSLCGNNIFRKLKNLEITLTSFFYKRISVISESLARELMLSKKKVNILPLGGEKLTSAEKSFEELNLLYVGTLTKRSVHESIYGLAYFLKLNPDLNISYDILGSGDAKSVSQLRKAIDETSLSEKVHYHGRKNLEELSEFYSKCNLGVVFIPETKYYDFQPSTKFFESVLAGMPVIATATYENLRILKEGCGVICHSNSKSFCSALGEIVKHRSKWDSGAIQSAYLDYTWENIVKNRFECLFTDF